MARRCALTGAILIFFLCILPDPLLAARLELRELGSGLSDLDAMVGDEIEVSLWVDSDGQLISGAAVFLSFDEAIFELVDEDRQPAVAGFQPFAPGDFLGNGEIFRNVQLDPGDPAATFAGEQLDYSVVRALDQGRGPAATFRLRVRAPAVSTTIRIDENGFRETRFFTPDGRHQAFRFITPLSVRALGIGIEGLPERLVLSRGQIDTTTFRLDELIFDPVYGPNQIDWSVTSGSRIAVERLTEGNLLRLVAPGDASPWERITVTATNPDGQFASAFVDLFVNTAPELPDRLEAVNLQEDHSIEVSLAEIVSDPDTPIDRLTWSVSAPEHLGASVSGSPPTLHLSPALNWYGSAEAAIYAVDDYGFADTAAVSITVSPDNDAPRILVAPNVRLVRGRADSTLALSGLVDDVEDGAAGLQLRWSGQHHVGIEVRAGRLVLTAPPVWIGEETIQLEVEDSGGLTAVTPLTVSVVRSLAPSLQSPPQRLGLVAGDYAVVDLAAVAVDPDDADGDLAWSVSGSARLQVQLSGSGAARIEAPVDFALPEVLRFSVADPSGETAAFELLIFPASPDGAPAIAPLPEIALPAGGVDASIDLDDYLFDLDHQVADMEWFLPARDGMTLRIDPASHVLTVAVADSAAPGATTLQLRARDPDGLEAVQTLTIRIATAGTSPQPDPDALPVLASLPTLTVQAGEFDQSLDLDEYISGIDPSLVSWQASGQQHLQVFVDPGTRQVTVLAEAGWSGPEIIVLRGTDAAGNVVEGLLGVQVLAPLSGLKLRDLTEAALFAGDSTVVLDASALLDGVADLSQLAWSVSSPASLTATYLAADGSLVIAGSAFAQPGIQLVDLVARDSTGAEAAGRVLLQIHPIDGSKGLESEALRVAVVPNAIQPEFLDVFVLSDVAGGPPRLRLQREEWSEMALDSSGAGIWQGRHVLQPGIDGSVRFLALAMDHDWQPLAADFAIQVATARPGTAKRIAMPGATVDFGPDAFAAETVVAVLPAQVESAGEELAAAGGALVVYATRPFAGQSVQVALANASPGAAVYRWDDGEGRWSYLGGENANGDLRAASTRLGRFAALVDRAAPRLVERQVEAAAVRLQWRDGGSGIASVSVSIDDRPLPEAAYTWDGLWLCVEGDWVSSSATITARAMDRAGNRAHLVIDLVATRRPRGFALGHNYPNPFNPTTTIPLRMAAGTGPVRVEVYNAAGQRVRLLWDDTFPAGQHHLVWDGCDGAGRVVASGVYFFRAVVGGRAATRKMTLSR